MFARKEPRNPASGHGGQPGFSGGRRSRWAKVALEAIDAAGTHAGRPDVFRSHQGQHAHHRRDGPRDEAPVGCHRPRHRRTRHTSALRSRSRSNGCSRPGRPQRRSGPPDRIRRRTGLCRPGGRIPNNVNTGSSSHLSHKETTMASTEEIRRDLADICERDRRASPTAAVQLDKSFTDDLDLDSLGMVEVASRRGGEVRCQDPTRSGEEPRDRRRRRRFHRTGRCLRR